MDKPWVHKRNAPEKIYMARKFTDTLKAISYIIVPLAVLRNSLVSYPTAHSSITGIFFVIFALMLVWVAEWTGNHLWRGRLRIELADLWEGIQLARSQREHTERR